MDMISIRRKLMAQVQQLIPPEYVRVNKLISTGTDSSFPYINTGIIPTTNYGFDVICESYSIFTDNPGFGCIFGGRVGSGNKDFQVTTFTANATTGKGTLRWGDSVGNSLNAHLTLNTRLQLTLNNNEYFVDGVKIGGINSYIAGSVPIYLFALNNNGIAIQHGMGCAIYRATFFDADGIAVADFVPVIRKIDSEPGMYDLVSKTFFTNDGAGEFIVSENFLSPDDFEQGAIAGSPDRGGYTYTQRKEISNTRIRTKNLIQLDPTKTYELFVGSGYNVCAHNFDANGLSIQSASPYNIWTSRKVTITNQYYIAVAIRRENQANISPSDAASTEITLYEL